MPFSLNCPCGAHLEVDDVFAGKSVNCPDCSLPLQVPTQHAAHVRTSGLALASLVLALVGAFTIIGTLAAVVLGILALVSMHAKPDRLTGRGYAVSGIALGVLLTAVTLVLFMSSELFGLSRLLTEAQWAAKLDYSGEDEIIRTKEGFAISRPSKSWGVYTKRQSDSPGKVDNLSTWDDLLFVWPSQDAHILCMIKPTDERNSIDRCRDDAVEEFKMVDAAGFYGREGLKRKYQKFESRTLEQQPAEDSIEIIETRIDKSLAGQDRTFLMRVIKQRGARSYFILIAGTRSKKFDGLEKELRKGLDSFRVLNAGAQP